MSGRRGNTPGGAPGQLPDYLQDILASTRRRVLEAKRKLPLEALQRQVEERLAAERQVAKRQAAERQAAVRQAAGQAANRRIGAGEGHASLCENSQFRHCGLDPQSLNLQLDPEPRLRRSQDSPRLRRSQDDVYGVFTQPDGFLAALKKPGLSFICEVKQASPSKGRIARDFDHLGIAREYLAAGADAISVLTEPGHFKGSDSHLAMITDAIRLPALRKDFILEEYQVYESKALGASAVLLIAAILDDGRLRDLLLLCESLGMDALAEAHDEHELSRVLCAGARIVGVNNRDLRTFEVDIATSQRLRPLVPADVAFVAESGMSSPQDVRRMALAGADAVLVGEALMRAQDRKAKLAELKSAANGADEGGAGCAASADGGCGR
jgi:indole-3-glycerol phosphate synthase